MARTSAQQKLGIKIRSIRLELNMTQEIVADITGLDRTYISGIERGIRNPSIKNIDKIAKALKVSSSTLMS
jgi:transcriptional regulator with XRE-family HTH domain